MWDSIISQKNNVRILMKKKKNTFLLEKSRGMEKRKKLKRSVISG